MVGYRLQRGAWVSILLTLLLTGSFSSALAQDDAIVLVSSRDPYLILAQEIASEIGAPLVHNLDMALTYDPTFVIWVASPSHLSDQAIIDIGLTLKQRNQALSTGIISGSTLDQARALWQRAAQVQTGDGQICFANAANPSGNIQAGITCLKGSERTTLPLTRDELVRSLQRSDYVTFTGHGGQTFLGLGDDLSRNKNSQLRGEDLADLPPVVIATGSCNTFRPWAEESIALAFVDSGAAAYAGFAYSPNEGYLIGEFRGLPFRYTWPDYPIGHVVQVQNQGTLQGFARLPYYHLLGDPRLAFQDRAPYELLQEQTRNESRILTFSAAPAGIIPVRVTNGAQFTFVRIPGVDAAWKHGPFYSARIQMADIGPDKYILFDHPGGEFQLELHPQPPFLWLVSDIVVDALDHTWLALFQGESAWVYLSAAGLVLLVAAWRILRRRAWAVARPAALVGLVAALLHGVYAVLRAPHVSVTSKTVLASPWAPLTTFLLIGGGTVLFLTAHHWWGKALALLIGCLEALFPAVFMLSVLTLINLTVFVPKVGTRLYTYRPVWLFGFAFALLGSTLSITWSLLKRPSNTEVLFK